MCTDRKENNDSYSTLAQFEYSIDAEVQHLDVGNYQEDNSQDTATYTGDDE